MNIYKGNDFFLRVRNFSIVDEGTLITDATMTATLNDSDESAVSGFDGLTVSYNSSKKQYELTVDKAVFTSLSTSTQYNLVVQTSNYDWLRGIRVFIIDESVIP